MREARIILRIWYRGSPLRTRWPSARSRRASRRSRLTLAHAVAQGFLLDVAAYLIERVVGGLDDMEGAWDAGGILELIIDGVLVSLERVQCRDLDTGAELLVAFGQPVAVGRVTGLAPGQQPGRGTVPSPGHVP